MDFEKEAQDIADEIERPYISDQDGVGAVLQRLIAQALRRAYEAGKREAFEEAAKITYSLARNRDASSDVLAKCFLANAKALSASREGE